MSDGIDIFSQLATILRSAGTSEVRLVLNAAQTRARPCAAPGCRAHRGGGKLKPTQPETALQTIRTETIAQVSAQISVSGKSLLATASFGSPTPGRNRCWRTRIKAWMSGPAAVKNSTRPSEPVCVFALRPVTLMPRCTHTPAVRTGDNRVAHTGHNLCLQAAFTQSLL